MPLSAAASQLIYMENAATTRNAFNGWVSIYVLPKMHQAALNFVRHKDGVEVRRGRLKVSSAQQTARLFPSAQNAANRPQKRETRAEFVQSDIRITPEGRTHVKQVHPRIVNTVRLRP